MFFALWPDAAVARALHAWAQACAPQGARVTRRDTLHLTVAFIGDVDSGCVGAIEAVGDDVPWPRLDLTLTHVGGWRHNRIAYAAPDDTPAALAELAASLADGLRAIGIELEERAFHPHATLARRCAQLRPFVAPAPIVWPVREGVLVESKRDAQGAHYHVRRRWPAQAAQQ